MENLAGDWGMWPAPHRLVHGVDWPLRQGLLAPGQEAKVRDESAQEKPQPQIRPNLRLQEPPICVSASLYFMNRQKCVPILENQSSSISIRFQNFWMKSDLNVWQGYLWQDFGVCRLRLRQVHETSNHLSDWIMLVVVVFVKIIKILSTYFHISWSSILLLLMIIVQIFPISMCPCQVFFLGPDRRVPTAPQPGW